MIRRFAAVAGLVVASLLIAVNPVAAADPVTFGTPKASSSFGVSIEFQQPVTLSAAASRVELLLRTPGAAGPNVTEIEQPTTTGQQTLRFSVDLTAGHIVPNTTFTARWRVTTADGKTWLGPELRHTYADDRVTWKTLEGKIVRVHWYVGSNAFGQRALRIGDDAVAETSKLLGVTETEPIDFYIYADQDKFYDALGPGTRENVGGEAHSDIRTLFALITPGEIDDPWVGIVVPHELTHLVFATAIENPYHEPPHWLNEGLAVYNSQGFVASDRSQVEGAAGGGTIIPLSALAGAFPTTQVRFFLGYAESVSAVDYMIRTYGQDHLISLIRSYSTGVSDDEAFSAALGVDTAKFEEDWLASLNAVEPVRHGPQPPPPGPLPEGWSGAAPNPSVVPGASRPPTSAPAAPGRGTSSGLSFPTILVVLLVIGLVVARGLVVYSRRQSPAPDPQPSAPTPPPPPTDEPPPAQ